MSTARLDPGEKLASIRAAFDRTYASPLPDLSATHLRLLAIGVGEDPFAVRIEEVTGIALDRKVVPFLGGPPGFQGLAGSRGRLLAVYSLAALLGYERKGEPARWVLHCRSQPTVGLSFDRFDGYLEVDPAALHCGPLDRTRQGHVREFLEEGSGARGVVNVASILESIERAAVPGNHA